jgi:hypothetical protein
MFDIGCDDEGLGMTRYGIDKAPAWLAMNTSSGVLSGRPTNDDVGPYTVFAFVNDGWGGQTNLSFDVIVTDVNDPPLITTSDILAATQDIPYNVAYQASDIDPVKETFSWNLATNASWLKMDGPSGLLWGTPRNSDVGSWWVNVSVDDGRGGRDSSNFTLSVKNVNDPPAITTGPATIAIEEVEYAVDFNATDIDAGDMFTWSLSTTADWLAINATSGVLSGTPAEEDVGSAWISVTVTDAAGANSTVDYLLRVQNVNDPPAWISVPGDMNMTENQTMLVNVLAQDPDAGDDIRYAISSEPSIAISVNAVSGAIFWMNAAAGNYTVTVTAMDGLATISHLFNLTVNAIVLPPPPPPPANNPPKINPVANATIRAGEALGLKLAGSDNDSYDAANLTFRLVSGPAGLVISADGTIAWTPTKDQVGTQTVTVSLSDGKNTTVASFPVTVAKPAPVKEKESDSGSSPVLMAGLLIAGVAIGAVAAVAAYSLRKKPA